jgi:hypothetical protein
LHHQGHQPNHLIHHHGLPRDFVHTPRDHNFVHDHDFHLHQQVLPQHLREQFRRDPQQVISLLILIFHHYLLLVDVVQLLDKPKNVNSYK